MTRTEALKGSPVMVAIDINRYEKAGWDVKIAHRMPSGISNDSDWYLVVFEREQ